MDESGSKEPSADGLTDEQRELAALHGVATEYEDWQHNPAQVSAETVLAVLDALGVDARTPQAARESLRGHRRAHDNRVLPRCVVVTQGKTSPVPFHPGDERCEVWVETEGGKRLDLPYPVGDGASGLTLPDDLPTGYHALHARTASGDSSATVIVTPAVLGLPASLGDRRGWGFAVQLYSVRSAQSWGVGDLRDLRALLSWSGRDLGADFLLLNPLSAAEPVPPMEPSPYLPSSRAFVNPLYLHVEDVPGYGDLPPDERATVESVRRDARGRLDATETIDRDAAWAAKRQALQTLYDHPQPKDRETALRDFVEREGEALRDFATWCALTEEHGADWHAWPAELHHPCGEAVAAYRERHRREVDFHCWLQWLLDEQLARAQDDALGAGMRLGVVHDLAVGVHPSGADSWTHQEALALGVSVGAPPDAFNQKGQDWSQPPWRPDRLVDLAYQPYRDLIARLLRHAGGIRVDHVIGLFRLWWIPQGAGPDRGTYVRYDAEAMVGILALEGQRAGAVVVGEDLGNVEPEARSYLSEREVLGTSILWWEVDEDGDPLPRAQWRECSMASVTTHDLPPTAGYLAGEHVDLRKALGLLTRPVEEERAADEADREKWLDRLRDEGLLQDGADTEQTVAALYGYVAATPARLVCVALTDAVGDRRTQNQPGTTDEYPNWRVPLSGPDGEPLALEDVVTSERASRLAGTVRRGLERSDR